MCVVARTACNRQQSKVTHPQVFNSVIQVEGKFFKMRNLDHQLGRRNKNFDMKMMNTGSFKPGMEKRKSVGHSPPQS